MKKSAGEVKVHNAGEFRKLLLASFVSQIGSHFLTLAIAAFVLYASGSPVQSALVFVVSFLPSILVSARLGHWVDSRISRVLFARNELISILATIAAGVSIALHLPLALLCVLLGFRSLLMFVSRAAATKWLKIISTPEQQMGRIKLFYLSFFLSTAISGMLAGIVLSHASIWAVVTLDAISYILGVLILVTLNPLPASPSLDSPARVAVVPEPSLRQTLRTIFMMPVVRTSFLVVCLSQALFQGSYSVLVSVLPIQVFNLGLSGVGPFQLAASFGITGGFLINWFLASSLTERLPTRPTRAISVASLTAAALLVAVCSATVPGSLVAFFALNLGYECIWLHHNSDFFRASPKSAAARYQFTLSACAAFLMATFTLIYSVLIQVAGAAAASIAIVGLGGLLALVAALVGRRAELLPAVEGATS